jgi:hypothetical protein
MILRAWMASEAIKIHIPFLCLSVLVVIILLLFQHNVCPDFVKYDCASRQKLLVKLFQPTASLRILPHNSKNQQGQLGQNLSVF